MQEIKKLPSQKTLKQFFDYDAAGFLVRKKAYSNLKVGEKIKGTLKRKDNIQVRFMGELFMYHRLVYQWHFGKTPKIIDHKNGLGFDNRIENLRPATVAQNAQNLKIRKDNASGFRGVYWSEQHKKWRASISCERQRKHLGLFDTPENANIAFKKAQNILHGEFKR